MKRWKNGDEKRKRKKLLFETYISSNLKNHRHTVLDSRKSRTWGSTTAVISLSRLNHNISRSWVAPCLNGENNKSCTWLAIDSICVISDEKENSFALVPYARYAHECNAQSKLERTRSQSAEPIQRNISRVHSGESTSVPRTTNAKALYRLLLSDSFSFGRARALLCPFSCEENYESFTFTLTHSFRCHPYMAVSSRCALPMQFTSNTVVASHFFCRWKNFVK